VTKAEQREASEGETIFISLLDESVDVWRPVQAERLRGNTFLILEQPYDRELETWQFGPGEVVLCEEVQASDGPILAAARSGSR
jgi:hypothetical protein